MSVHASARLLGHETSEVCIEGGVQVMMVAAGLDQPSAEEEGEIFRKRRRLRHAAEGDEEEGWMTRSTSSRGC
ncbi:hypothetical protein KXD40_006495 [Peronospora effusa]|uniref:Uncharacterized protein n=1 Tax=Peronospora effusa TaxID=542832 RepID=A0A3M6V9S1_9STRA|nr:hypothetical protein DD238_008301 [Peronospora effusa]RQM11200.1 hypothetical protein DD237_008334 [Peronospora effusa]UIZ25405.1 hypothetical protein KXD40_006495 [Peronospora effusa]